LEGDNDNKYPMAVSVTNGGAMESTATGDVVNCFFVMSNELSTQIFLVCPMDTAHTSATDFGGNFNNSHISYFVDVDVTNENPAQRVLCGDDNFLINGSPIKSGLVQYPTNISIAWGSDRHKFVGNIGYADGSVSELSIAGLQTAFLQSGLSTNRLAIP
jgi:prepilin-type processing-associated H-X9-DG protein